MAMQQLRSPIINRFQQVDLKPSELKARLKDPAIRKANKSLCRELGSFKLTPPKDEQTYQSHVQDRLQYTGKKGTKEPAVQDKDTAGKIAEVYANNLASPAQLKKEEVAELKKLLSATGCMTDALSSHLDALTKEPQQPEKKPWYQTKQTALTNAWETQQKEIAKLRVLLVRSYKLSSTEHQEGSNAAPKQAKAIAQLPEALILCMPVSVQKEFIYERRDVLTSAICNAGFGEEEALHFVNVKGLETKDPQKLKTMISFALRHPHGSEYHPREGVWIFQMLSKQPLQVGTFRDVVKDLPKAQRRHLENLYRKFLAEAPGDRKRTPSEKLSLKTHLTILITNRAPFSDCKRAIQFWDILTIGQRHSASRYPTEDPDAAMGKVKCTKALEPSMKKAGSKDLETFIRTRLTTIIQNRAYDHSYQAQFKEKMAQLQGKREGVDAHPDYKEAEEFRKGPLGFLSHVSEDVRFLLHEGLVKGPYFKKEAHAYAEQIVIRSKDGIDNLTAGLLKLAAVNPDVAVRLIDQLDRQTESPTSDGRLFEETPLYLRLCEAIYRPELSDVTITFSADHKADFELATILLARQDQRTDGDSPVAAYARKRDGEIFTREKSLLSHNGIKAELKHWLREIGCSAKQVNFLLEMFSHEYKASAGSSHSRGIQFALRLIDLINDEKSPEELVIWAKTIKYQAKLGPVLYNIGLNQEQVHQLFTAMGGFTTRQDQKDFMKYIVKALQIITKDEARAIKKLVKDLKANNTPSEKIKAAITEAKKYVGGQQFKSIAAILRGYIVDTEYAFDLDEAVGTLDSNSTGETVLSDRGDDYSMRGPDVDSDVVYNHGFEEDEDETRPLLDTVKPSTPADRAVKFRGTSIFPGVDPTQITQSLRKRGLLADGGEE